MAEEIRKSTRPDMMTGITKIEYADAEDITATTPAGPESKTVSARTGAFAAIDLKNATKESELSDGYFKNSVKGTLADWDNVMGVSLWQLSCRRFVLKVTDAQGRVWGLGTKEEPLRMRYRKTNGPGPETAQGTEVEFHNTSTEGIWTVTGQ